MVVAVMKKKLVQRLGRWNHLYSQWLDQVKVETKQWNLQIEAVAVAVAVAVAAVAVAVVVILLLLKEVEKRKENRDQKVHRLLRRHLGSEMQLCFHFLCERLQKGLTVQPRDLQGDPNTHCHSQSVPVPARHESTLACWTSLHTRLSEYSTLPLRVQARSSCAEKHTLAVPAVLFASKHYSRRRKYQSTRLSRQRAWQRVSISVAQRAWLILLGFAVPSKVAHALFPCHLRSSFS